MQEEGYFFGNDDDILLFEILVRKIKMEMNKILRENDKKKSNLDSCNSKKDLVTRYLNADEYDEREMLKSEIVSFFFFRILTGVLKRKYWDNYLKLSSWSILC